VLSPLFSEIDFITIGRTRDMSSPCGSVTISIAFTYGLLEGMYSQGCRMIMLVVFNKADMKRVLDCRGKTRLLDRRTVIMGLYYTSDFFGPFPSWWFTGWVHASMSVNESQPLYQKMVQGACLKRMQ